MSIREITTKGHIYHQLVRSYRGPQGPRQEILLHLGDNPSLLSAHDEWLVEARNTTDPARNTHLRAKIKRGTEILKGWWTPEVDIALPDELPQIKGLRGYKDRTWAYFLEGYPHKFEETSPDGEIVAQLGVFTRTIPRFRTGDQARPTLNEWLGNRERYYNKWKILKDGVLETTTLYQSTLPRVQRGFKGRLKAHSFSRPELAEVHRRAVTVVDSTSVYKASSILHLFVEHPDNAEAWLEELGTDSIPLLGI